MDRSLFPNVVSGKEWMTDGETTKREACSKVICHLLVLSLGLELMFLFLSFCAAEASD